MEENNTNENNELVSEKESKKESKENSKKKNKESGNSPSFFSKHKAEFRKIKWPSRQELFRETVVVIIISLIVGAIIFGMDTVLQFGFGKISNLL